MKHFHYKYLVIVLVLFSCKKEQEFYQSNNDNKIVNLRVIGVVEGTDTLQLKTNGRLLVEIPAKSGMPLNPLQLAGTEIQISKKSDGSVLGKFTLSQAPFQQVKKIYYDGTTLVDSIQVTPVADKNNVGMRLRFKAPVPDYNGQAVDIEIFERAEITDPVTFDFHYSYKSVKLVSGVSQTFGVFFELPPLPPNTNFDNYSYVFKVYKSGTKDLPYTMTSKIQISDPDNNYGSLPFFVAGKSQLLTVEPFINIAQGFVFDGYNLNDLAEQFQ